MRYDCIVIGAGNGGLIAALSLQKEKKKVLLLEKNLFCGGLTTSFKRGNFLFDVLSPTFFSLGNSDSKESLSSVFQELNVLDSFQYITRKEAYHVVSLSSHESYTMPFEISKFILQMEEYVPNSLLSMQEFFDLAKEVNEALSYIKNHPSCSEEEIIKSYPNFSRVSSYSVDVVLEALEVPKKAQNILTAGWSHFGAPTNILSFVHFASKIYEYLQYGSVHFHMSHSSLSEILLSRFIELGGVFKGGSSVSEVLFENKEIVGVKCLNGEKYFSNHIISNVSPSVFYGSFLSDEHVLSEANRLCNSRTLGAQGLCLYVGISQSAKDLGITHEKYIICDTLDSSKEYLKTKELFHDHCVVSVLPNYNEVDAPLTILQFSSLYFDQVFSKFVNEKNYFSLKEQVAQRFLDAFEEATNIEIQNEIVEIEVATPVTFAKEYGVLNGSIYGYLPKGYDNLVPRLLNEFSENYLRNVHFCGSFTSSFSAFEDTYLSGYHAAQKTLKDMEGESNHGNHN